MVVSIRTRDELTKFNWNPPVETKLKKNEILIKSKLFRIPKYILLIFIQNFMKYSQLRLHFCI